MQPLAKTVREVPTVETRGIAPSEKYVGSALAKDDSDGGGGGDPVFCPLAWPEMASRLTLAKQFAKTTRNLVIFSVYHG